MQREVVLLSVCLLMWFPILIYQVIFFFLFLGVYRLKNVQNETAGTIDMCCRISSDLSLPTHWVKLPLLYGIYTSHYSWKV